MKLKGRSFLAGIVVGAVCGAFGIRSLVAETVEPPAYLVVNTDQYKSDPIFYHSMVSAVIAGFKGKVLVEDARPAAVDDTADLPAGTISLIAFNTMADLKAFRDSQKYKDVLATVTHASKVRHFALEGRPSAK
jgi:uncharacterized protein (DUF1330 family)